MLRKAVFAIVCASGLAAGAAACTGSAAGVVDRDILLPKEHDTIAAVVPANSTFDALLRSTSTSMTRRRRRSFRRSRVRSTPRALKAARSRDWLIRTLDGQFREFRYEIDATKYLRAWRVAPARTWGLTTPYRSGGRAVSARGRGGRGVREKSEPGAQLADRRVRGQRRKYSAPAALLSGSVWRHCRFQCRFAARRPL